MGTTTSEEDSIMRESSVTSHPTIDLTHTKREFVERFVNHVYSTIYLDESRRNVVARNAGILFALSRG